MCCQWLLISPVSCMSPSPSWLPTISCPLCHLTGPFASSSNRIYSGAIVLDLSSGIAQGA